VDGKALPQINPAVAFPTINSGDAYQGGDANGMCQGFETTSVKHLRKISH
jgi:hypothetical protein